MKIVAVSPHADDAEWGAGALLHRLAAEGFNVQIVVLTHYSEERDQEARAAAEVLGAHATCLGLANDGTLGPVHPRELRTLEVLTDGADLVLHPPEFDTHQDHRATRDLVLAACRRSRVSLWEYPTPSVYNWAPNSFTPVEEVDVQRKVASLRRHRSQAGRPYMAPTLARARARVSGANIGALYAEEFRVHRMVT